MNTDYTPEHLAEVASDPTPLVDRLEGNYNNPLFTRKFRVPAIQVVAAGRIRQLEARVAELETRIEELENSTPQA